MRWWVSEFWSVRCWWSVCVVLGKSRWFWFWGGFWGFWRWRNGCLCWLFVCCCFRDWECGCRIGCWCVVCVFCLLFFWSWWVGWVSSVWFWVWCCVLVLVWVGLGFEILFSSGVLVDCWFCCLWFVCFCVVWVWCFFWLCW